jgi:ABC-type sulfate/molybdate transport systems ATPase subunit
MRLELEQLEVRAGDFHLGPISLAVDEGEYLVVLGPTGAGKTVTLETIAGLRTADAGLILMDGRDVARAAPELRRIGFLYQDSLLFPHLSVRENVAYGAHRLPRAQRADAIARLTRLLQIDSVIGRVPRGLSGGERQRVALARALAGKPVILLLDEPMASLDPNSRLELRQTLLRLHRELGTTTVHVTHDFAEALALADRVAIMIEGKLLQVGAPREVFSKPDSAAIASFLKSTRFNNAYAPSESGPYAAVISPRRLNLAGGSGAGMPVLEAHEVEIETAGCDEDGEAIGGRIISIENDGGAIRLSINIGLELRAVLAANPAPDALVQGAGVLVRLPKSRG